MSCLIVISSSGLFACGEDEQRTSNPRQGASGLTTESKTQSAPEITTPTQTATSPTQGSTAPDEGATGNEGTTTTELGTGGYGAGDEEPIRVPADFTISRAGITPGRVTVPAFLTIALQASSKDGRAHTLRITTTRGPVTVNVPAGGSGSKDVVGLPKGEYLIALDGQATDSALVVGGEPGP